MQLDAEMIPYVLYEVDTAGEDLKGAKILIDNEMYRISLNRSYYCVFHTIKALATLNGEKFSKHSGYISYFRQAFIKTGIFDADFNKIVSKTQRLRESGDYGDMIKINREDAMNDYNAASTFYEQVSQYIRNEIEKYK